MSNTGGTGATGGVPPAPGGNAIQGGNAAQGGNATQGGGVVQGGGVAAGPAVPPVSPLRGGIQTVGTEQAPWTGGGPAGTSMARNGPASGMAFHNPNSV